MEIRLSWPGHPATRAAVVMRTPGSDFELAAGFLLSDGVIANGRPPTPGGLLRRPGTCRRSSGTTSSRWISTRLPGAILRAVRRRSRRHAASAEPRAWTRSSPRPTRSCPITRRSIADVIRSLPDSLRERQPLFGKTGLDPRVRDLHLRRGADRHPRGRRPPQHRRQGARRSPARHLRLRQRRRSSASAGGWDSTSSPRRSPARSRWWSRSADRRAWRSTLPSGPGSPCADSPAAQRFVVYTHPERISGAVEQARSACAARFRRQPRLAFSYAHPAHLRLASRPVVSPGGAARCAVGIHRSSGRDRAALRASTSWWSAATSTTARCRRSTRSSWPTTRCADWSPPVCGSS